MNDKEIVELIESSVANALSQQKLADYEQELSSLKETNKELVTKISSVSNAEIPEEKVQEITEVVRKAISEEMDTLVGEALEKVVDKVEDLEGSVGEIKESMTNRQRIKKALSNRNAFKPMSRQSRAYTNCSEAQTELEAIAEALKNAKDQKAVEDVKNLLQAFIKSSSKMVQNSANEDEKAELEAYHQLGTIDEIEAAVEVLETYADEIGSLKELSSENPKEKIEEKVELKEEFSSKRKALASKRQALVKRKQALASKKEERKQTLREKIMASRQKAIASKKAIMSSSARAEKIKELKAKRLELSNLKNKEEKKSIVVSSTTMTPGALATSLFSRNK